MNRSPVSVASPAANAGWLGGTRLAAGLLLVGLAVTVGGTFVRPAGVGAAGAAAVLLATWTWVRPGGRVAESIRFVLDLGWIGLAVVAAGRYDAGLALLFPLAAFGAGVTLGGRTGAVIGLGAAVGLFGVSWHLGATAEVPGQVGLQEFLLLVLGVASARLRTSAVRSERALHHASRALERMRLDTDTIVENLGSGLLSVDGAGRIVHVNRTAAETLGRAADEIRGLTLREALLPGAAGLVEVLEDGLATGAAERRREIRIRRGDVAIPLGLGTTVLRGPDGETNGLAVLFQDLTEVHRQQELERRRERLAAIGELAAGIAHEIRNSILPVSGSVQLLTQEIRPVGEQKKLFEVIERETDNVERFVSSLLSYTRLQSLRPAAVELGAIAREVVAEPRVGRNGLPDVRCEGDAAAAWADGEQMRQVARNLLANAVEAAGEGGTVWVRTGTEADGRVRLEIEDNGPGVPDDERDAVLRPFYTTKAGGTGLGLSVVSRIVEDHDGELKIERGHAGGARFVVLMPGAREHLGALAA